MAESVLALAAVGGGNAAGASLAKKIMPQPNPVGPDTSIPGISKAVIQQGGKSNKELSVAQVDPSNAISYFQQAANAYQGQALQGLGLYTQAMQQAISSSTKQYQTANDRLDPIVQQGRAATDEYMRMIGLDPIAHSTSEISQLQNAGITDWKNTDTSSLQDAITAANQIRDPTQRAAAKQQINDQFGSYITELNDMSRFDDSPNKAVQNFLETHPVYQPGAANQAAVNAGKPENFQGDTITTYAQNPDAVKAFWDSDNNPYPLSTASPYYNTPSRQYQQLKSAADQYNQQIQSIKDQNKTSTDQLNTILKNFNSDYSNTYDSGYTGDQIAARLQNTPGYQFQLSQGNQAIARTAQASGMLGSGNTAAGTAQFSQNVAMSTYQQYLNNLGYLSQSGNTASSQQSNNDMAQGGSLAQLYGNLGSGTLSTYTGIGQAYNNAYTNAGQTTFQADLANMQAQNAAIAQKNNQQFAQGNQAIQAGYLNLANQQFNYQQQQNQNYGAGFAYNPSSRSGFPTYQNGQWSV